MAVPYRTRIAYALPAFALAVVGIPIYVYIPKFYTDVVGVDIATIGALLLLIRSFDAISDPVIGALSDRTTSGWGRRRPYLLYGVVPLALSIYLLFVPPPGRSPGAATWGFGATLMAAFLLWTIVTVPYESLGPEVSFDYDERTSILGLRDGLLILGTVAAAASPAVAAALLHLTGDAPGERTKFAAVALAYAPILIVFCWICVAGVHEHARAIAARPTSNPWREARSLFGNRPFVILLASYTVTALGGNLPATLIPYYVQYVIGDPDASSFLLLYFVTGVLLLPFWIWLARRIGKKSAWLWSGSLNAASFACVFFLGQGQSTAFAVLVAVSGIGFGATLALPSAMQADVIDYEEYRSGHRREGEIIGVWSVAKKLAAALSVGAALPILGWVGYVPNAVQSPAVQLTLRTMYALVPAALTLVGLAIALTYPLNKQAHQRTLVAIDARRRGAVVADPLIGPSPA